MEKIKSFWEWFKDFSFNYVSDEELTIKLLKQYEENRNEKTCN